MSPLSKRHRTNPELTERFGDGEWQGGMQCLQQTNDPIDQLERFRDQMKLGEKGDDEAMIIDHDYVRAMEYGMPTCSGLGVGIAA